MADPPETISGGDQSNVGPSVSQSVPQAQFTDEQKVRLAEWFQTKWNHRECPVCQANAYAAPDKAWEIRPFRGGQTVIGGQGGIIPMFPVMCTNCGYIIWINAIVAGIIGNRPKSESS